MQRANAYRAKGQTAIFVAIDGKPAGLLGGIGGQGKRRKPVIEGQRRARADFIARLFRIAAVEHARGLGRREAPGEDG